MQCRMQQTEHCADYLACRTREYLTEKEVERLIEAARKRGRNGPRDAAAILLAYRHGFRAAELCQLPSTLRPSAE
jgi:site-specific recombinase XerD